MAKYLLIADDADMDSWKLDAKSAGVSFAAWVRSALTEQGRERSSVGRASTRASLRGGIEKVAGSTPAARAPVSVSADREWKGPDFK